MAAFLQPAWELFISSADKIVEHGWPHAQAATLVFPAADEMATLLGGYLGGQSVDTVRYLVGLLLAYPLGALLGLVASQFQSPIAYHFLNIVIGICMAMWVFGPAWTVLAAFAGLAYTILLIGNYVRVVGKYQHVLMMVFCMSFMTAVHLHRLHVDYMGWTLDVSGPIMIAVIKLTSLSFNILDGANSGEYQKAIAAALAKTGKAPSIFTDRLSVAVHGLPGPLQFFGFIFCAPTLLAGPAVEFVSYEQAATNTAAPWGSRMLASLLKMLLGVACFGFTAVGGSYIPRGLPSAGDVTLIPNAILAAPFLHKAAWTWALMFTLRFKYYGAWKLSEGAANMAGIGWNAKEGNWDAATNMAILAFEFATSAQAALKAWNIRTQVWLQRYVFFRLPQTGGLNMVATYFLSALWHGFYPGYYLTFLSAPLFASVEKTLFDRLSPLAKAGGYEGLLRLAGIVACSLSMNYLVIPFQALGWQESIIAWSSFSYVGHAVAVGAYLLAVLVLPAPKKAVGGGAVSEPKAAKVVSGDKNGARAGAASPQEKDLGSPRAGSGVRSTSAGRTKKE